MNSICSKFGKVVLDKAFPCYGRVLIAEDEPTTRRLLERYLKSESIEAVHAESGLEALLKSFAEHIDLVLLDLNLPVLSGAEAARRLRSDGFARPIVIMSASSEESLAEECKGSGCDAFIVKPFSRSDFDDLMSDYFKRCREEEFEAAPETDPLLDEAIREVVKEFVKNLPSRVAKIQSAAAASDWKAVIEETHKLRGAGMFGFMRLSQLCGKIESSLRAGQTSAVAVDVSDLAALCRRIASRYAA
ncbi:MAG: response regulator [Bdellovibrionales bacterium]|nr:response regulator [Bdellovibrionales bacterium]